MIRIRTGLGRDVNLRGATTELSRIDAGLHFEFLQSVNRRQNHERVEVRVGVFHTVQGVAVVLGALTTDGNALVGANATLTGTGLTGRREAEADVGGESHQLQNVATVQGQFDDTLVLDNGTDGCVLGLEQSRLCRNLDGFRYGTNLHVHIDANTGLDLKFQVRAVEGLETSLLGVKRVVAGLQRGESVKTVVVGLGGSGRVGCDVGDFDGGTGNCGGRRVAYFTRDVAKSLCKKARLQQQSCSGNRKNRFH